jgi:hypothetical protein
LGLEQAALLERSCLQFSSLAVLTLGDVEDNGVGVELRRGVAVDGSGGVMLEGRGGELAGRLRLPDVADPSLGVPFQLSQSDPNAIAVRLAHSVVSSDQCGQRNRLRR